MGPELLVALLGPAVGAVFGLSVFFVRRTVTSTDIKLTEIAENVEVISHQVTALQVKLPTTYVTKDDLVRHIQSEERWQNEVLSQIRDLRDEIKSNHN